ncbi:MAG: DUF1778 domain-containing protein [Rhodocyclales bacterium]|nr:DUF1778 domain-containing protein [Rhodocyclales bacterium]
MPATTSEWGRVSARVPAQVLETLELAAAMVGTPVNQFMVQTALREAERIIEQERVIRLSARDAETFIHALENPPPPSARLKAALKQHRNANSKNEDSSFDWKPRPNRV